MTINTDTLIAKVVELRDRRSVLAKAFKEKDEALKEGMDKLEAALLKRLNEAGSDSFKTDSGTAYIQVKNRYSAADWTGYWAWLRENNRLDMLEKRVSSTAVSAYFEEHGELPPFLNMSSEREVVVRRA